MSDHSDRSPWEHPDAQALLKDPTALRALLQSPQTRRLIALLQQQGNLNEAAKAAKQGDTSTLQEMLGRVRQSREGSDVLSELKKQLPN